MEGLDLLVPEEALDQLVFLAVLDHLVRTDHLDHRELLDCLEDLVSLDQWDHLVHEDLVVRIFSCIWTTMRHLNRVRQCCHLTMIMKTLSVRLLEKLYRA